jgi:hypothetical protein
MIVVVVFALIGAPPTNLAAQAAIFGHVAAIHAHRFDAQLADRCAFEATAWTVVVARLFEHCDNIGGAGFDALLARVDTILIALSR